MSTKFIPDRKCYQKFAVGHKNKVLPPYKYMWHKAFLEIAFFFIIDKKTEAKRLAPFINYKEKVLQTPRLRPEP